MKTIKMEKQKQLPKGFLSVNGNPTENAIMMFLIYLSFVPKNWNRGMVYRPAISIVRKHFGVDYGFENMIRWGINHGCCKSKTSSGRHNSMSRAHVLAQGLIGAGVHLSDVSMISVIKKAA
jgi:hypothetical protein